MRVTFFVFFLLGFFLSFQTFALNAPVHLEPVQSTFKKITIKWQNGDPGSQVTYQVYRNNSEIASVADTQYTDSSLETGTQYTYQVVAVSGGVTSSPSAALTVKTIKSATFDNSTSVEQVVDSLHPASASNFTGITLLSAVKSGLEALLGAGITFTAVDSDTLTSFIEEELAIIREVEPSMTDAERIAAQADLDATLSSGFGGNTFEHVYIQGKLSELAETHYQKGFKTGAAALYEFSLNYLSDQEPVVFGTLARLATFKIDTLTDTSTQVEIAAALADYKTTFLRLFDYFPNSVSIQAQSSYSLPAHKYFSYFPVLLNYGSYDSASFNNALQLAQSALLLNNDAIRQKFYDHIAAWELVPETIEFKDSSGNPLNGSITVRNITANTSSKDVFPGDPYEEERTVQVVSGQANFPVYKGHIYTAVVHFNVSGGNPLNYSIDSFTHEKGKNVTYNNLTTPVTENMASGTNYAKSSFVFDQPNYPYNLTYERAIDVFTLHWQWVSPSGFTLKNFKVFCGSSVVATVTGTTASNIPILPDADTHFYTVVAYDVNDNPSASSQTIFVVRDSAGYAGYFAWMQQYFGSQAMYSCDDPDGDQIDNFHEYLNGTDPTRIPGPAMLDPGQIGYSKAVLNWNPMFAGEAGVTYKLYRNDTEITPAISGTAYTDTGLTPGLTYTYRVRAVRSNGIDTEQGAPMAVRTVLPVTFNGSDKVQQVVDNLIPANAAQYTGSSLISAVKSGIEALSGSTVTFSTVSNDILNNFVTQELAIINEVTPSMTDAERLAAKTDLATMLNDNFGGNSFEHVYIQGKLTELGDEYYLKGDKEMGTALYELSLNYLKNMEPSVFSSLSRLATFKTDALTDTSTNEQIVTALDAYRDTYLRFFTFFPDSTSMQAQSAYVMPVYRYFKYFPALLKYDSYNQNVFNSAKQLSEAALAMNNSSISTARHARITAWELINLKVKLVATGDQPLSGTVTINNVSGSIPGNNVYPDTPVADSRTIPITSGEINVPVYKGHIYNVNSSLNISGYAMNVNSVLYQNGQSVKYTQGQTTPTTQSLPEGSNYAEVVFAYDVPPELIPSLDSDCDGIPDATELVLGYDPSIYTEIIYVDGVNGADANNGLSLAAAKRTINAAVTASKYSGKQHVIMVAAGTYTGTGNKNLDFGGYDIKLRSSAGSASTIIDLENSGRFAYFHTGESNQSWIDGFTIKNGNSDYGAGLRFDSAQAVVKNCVFSNNYAGGHGGAIYVNLRPLQVTNCKFSGNQAGTYAGALFLISSSGSELRNCEFTGNQAIASGGAECLFSSSQTVENCRFLGNQSSGNGGAVVTTSGSSLTLTNSLLLNNHASGSCSDLYLASSNDSLAMKNVTIAGGSSAYGFSCAFACPATLTNNIIQGNVSYIGATVANNNCSWNDFSANGSGNINFDPLLTVNGYLKTGSPCIDAGTSAGAPATDIDGVVRPAGSGVDIGCQEFKDTDGDGIPDNVEIAAGLDPYNPSDAALSKMNDGISNLDKYLNGMNPGSTDGDGDGITDAAELANGYDPSGYTELIYVDGVNGADANNGLSLAAAKRTINAAVTASKTAGKEHVIMVAAGTYTGSSNKNLDFGGYDIKLRSSAGAMATVIDLENSGRFAYFHTGESNQSCIDGFTVKNGSADYGAALRFNSAQAVVKNCVFEHNSAGGDGGAIYVNSRQLQVINCKFISNQAGTYAGALFMMSSSGSELRNCEFTGNQATHGGAEYLYGSSQTVENCRFLGNQSSGNAGAIVTTSGSSLALTNSLMLNNHANGAYSDLYLASSNDSLTMKNVTIAGGSSAYGFSCAFACPATLTNNIIQGNVSYIGATVANNNCSWNDFSASGSGNINFDPLLTVNGYLKTGSPCIDAGTALGAPATDIDGVVRPAGNGVDIGCQEFKDTDADGIPDNVEIAAGLDPYDPNDAALSKMNDGISNLDKYLNGMNPGSTDGDGDGISDAAELANGYDPSAYTEVIYVDASRTNDSGNGLSSATAKKTIGAAVTASKYSGKQHVIMVAAGTYTGSSNKNLDFGGYDIKLRSSAGAMATVIDLENSGRFAYFHTGESNQSWIDGFTVKNGSADYGAALRFNSAQAVIKNCVFEHNIAGIDGGAIQLISRPLQVINCKFISNQAGTYAGALFMMSSSGSELKNCEFSGNQATHGGAEYLYGSSQTVENCRFLGNQSSGNAGVIVTTTGSSLTLTNSLLLNNHANGAYSDLYLASSNDSLTMKNVTIAAGSSPGSISCCFSGPATLTNNIIQGSLIWGSGTLTANNNCSPADFSGSGNGNINSDPLLTVNGYLKTGSPCIDAGTATGAPAFDMDGVIRPAGNAVDIGCQEFKDTDADGIPDNIEIAAGLNPNDPSDAALSKMNDGISNLDKYLNGMNPGSADSDGDGIADAAELAIGSNPAVYSRVVYVNAATGSDTNDGLSLTAAKQSLGAAVNASKNAGGDNVIMVAAGIYGGTCNRNLDFGGYDIKLCSSAGAATAIIDLEQDGRLVYLHTGESSRSGIYGLTIRNGRNSYGGVVSLSNSSFTIRNCVITNNESPDNAGAVYIANGSLVVEKTTMNSNKAGGCGGVIYAENSNVKVSQSNFNTNTAVNGGAVALNNTKYNTVNCVYVNNSATNNGGAFHIESRSELVALNCSIGSNDNGNISAVWNDGSVNFKNSIIQDTLAGNGVKTVNYCCSSITDYRQTGSGNLYADPMLSIMGYLSPGSPCIDAGTADGAPAVDIIDQVRPAGSGVDIGCEEFADNNNNAISDYYEKLCGGTVSLGGEIDGLSILYKYQHGLNALKADTDGDGMNDKWEIDHGLNPYKNDALADNDADGLLNIEEYLAGTSPDNTDTDGDGKDDFWESKIAFTDPRTADFNGTETTVLTENGNNYINTFGGWDAEGTVVSARDRSGWVEYTLNVPQSGTYVVEVTGAQHISEASINSFKIGCYVNGGFSSYQTLSAAYGNTGSVRFFSPVLEPGNATVRLSWENVYRNTSLQINSLKLIRLGGVDANNNGIPDWMESRIDNMSKIKLPETSKVSPVCVEGENATFIEQITIDGFYTPEEETPVPPVVKHAAFNRWYADVPLNPSGASNIAVSAIAVSVQDGAKVTTKEVTWTPANVFTDEAAITIRMNDSLRLIAVPVGGADGAVSITVEGQTLDVTDGVPIPYKFTNAGDVTVTATYIPVTGDPVTRDVTVKVISASFTGNPACFVNVGRDWYNPNIGSEILLEADRNISFTDYGMTASGRRIYLTANNMTTAYTDARIYENGPIIDSARIDILDATTHANDGYHQILYTFEDGSVLIDGYVVLDKAPSEDITIRVVLWGGTMFEDGTKDKTFSASSFNSNNELHYNFIGPSSGFGTCQSVYLYQNGLLVKHLQ